MMLRRLDPPCPWDTDTCKWAANEGHLEVLQWIRRPGKPEGVCPWDANTCMYAAKGGHLEMLQWLRSGDNPCPWSTAYCRDWCGSLEVKQWIDAQPDE